MKKRRFLIERQVTSAEGTQTFWVDAENEDDALAEHRAGKGGIYSDECEVQGLGEPEIAGETELDDFGDFSPESTSKSEEAPLQSALLESLKQCLNFIEHREANLGKLTTDAEWDKNVREFRLSGPASIGVGRSYTDKACVDLAAVRSTIAEFEAHHTKPKEAPMTDTFTPPTLEETVARMKREILADISAGRVPASVKTFSALHDHVDANEYGGFCEDEFADNMIMHFGGRDEHEGMPQAYLNYMNAAQDAIGTWLAEGGADAARAPAATQRVAGG